jgi:hypothetical protein
VSDDEKGFGFAAGVAGFPAAGADGAWAKADTVSANMAVMMMEGLNGFMDCGSVDVQNN